jgi:hypothetical protein
MKIRITSSSRVLRNFRSENDLEWDINLLVEVGNGNHGVVVGTGG